MTPDQREFTKPTKKNGSEKMTTYNKFQSERYEYTSKGVKKFGTRTVRREQQQFLVDLKADFDSYSTKYLFHRFEIKNDHSLWPMILKSFHELWPIFWLDFSKNVAAIPKEQPQDAHFSAKQITLHCTVVYQADITVKYAYHISNDLGHDATFTFAVIDDLLSVFSAALDFPVICFKSDNCQNQYCCLHVFARLQNLSVKLDKTIIWYYGVPGHGRGLVDGMSGFGVKTPLRKAIIVNDFFYECAGELTTFLLEKFNGDNSKYYKEFDSKTLNASRNSCKSTLKTQQKITNDSIFSRW